MRTHFSIWQLILLSSILLFASTSLAQNRVHAGIGINASYAPHDSLNYVIGAFNDGTEWNGTDIRPIYVPGGISAHLGMDLAGVLLDLHYSMRLATRRAQAAVSATNPEPNIVQFRYNASSLDLGLGFVLLRKARFRLALGQSLDFGSLRIRGRRGPRTFVQGQVFGALTNELNLSSSTFLHAMVAFRDGTSPGIFIRPYVQWGFRKTDLGPLNRFLRPTEAVSDTYYILERQSNIGLKLGIMFGS